MSKKMIRFCLITFLFCGWPVRCIEADQGSEISSPNIILINLDDADTQMLSPENMKVYFPNLSRFSQEGVQFTNFHVTTPLCGPSRAALFRGQYAHRNGVRSNDPYADRSNGFPGGMKYYGQRGYHEDDIGNWMQSAGYRTMMIGKYLHGDTVDIVPTGWDDFYSSRGANYYATSRFTNAMEVQGSHRMENESTYRTSQEGKEARFLIDRHVARDNGKPFFMYLAPLAPHHHTPHDKNGMLEERYRDLWVDALMPLTADYLEQDFSDKSTAIRGVPLMHEKQMERLGRIYRERIVSMKSIDDFIGQLFEQLENRELRESTYVILTSDNGFSIGHHRMIGKGDSFDRSTHVPTYIIGPGIKPAKADHLLAHIDLAPTVLDMAGGEIPEYVDGRSFKQLVFEPESVAADEWRESILIENWESRNLQGEFFNTASLAVRYRDAVYTEWANGSYSFYDLTLDPLQIDNRFDSLDEERKRALAADLRKLWPNDLPVTTTITSPFKMNDVKSTGQPFVGMAEAGNPIERVDLVIQKLNDGLYWNGQEWQFSHVTVSAELANNDSLLTTWSYANVPAAVRQDELFYLNAQTITKDGRSDSRPPWLVFQLDFVPPESEILFPEKDADSNEMFVISGMASDNDKLDHVRLVIRNQYDKTYWDGESWNEKWCFIEVPVRSSGRWRYRNEWLEGHFYASSRAVDKSGNVQITPSRRYFSVTHVPESQEPASGDLEQ